MKNFSFILLQFLETESIVGQFSDHRIQKSLITGVNPKVCILGFGALLL